MGCATSTMTARPNLQPAGTMARSAPSLSRFVALTCRLPRARAALPLTQATTGEHRHSAHAQIAAGECLSATGALGLTEKTGT